MQVPSLHRLVGDKLDLARLMASEGKAMFMVVSYTIFQAFQSKANPGLAGGARLNWQRYLEHGKCSINVSERGNILTLKCHHPPAVQYNSEIPIWVRSERQTGIVFYPLWRFILLYVDVFLTKLQIMCSHLHTYFSNRFIILTMVK